MGLSFLGNGTAFYVSVVMLPGQELVQLRRVDPQQRDDLRLRHPDCRIGEVCHLHRQLDRHQGHVQADLQAVLDHVQAQGLLVPIPWRR